VPAFPGLVTQRGSAPGQRDAALGGLEFPQKPFRPGQRELAGGVYRACMQSRPLLVQAPTGIGKTIGTVYPALRPCRSVAPTSCFS
jgi:DNA excision repair protein ERCC-2